MAIQFPLQKKLDDTLSIYATQESLYDLSDQMIAFSDAGHIYADDGDKATLAAANTYTDQ